MKIYRLETAKKGGVYQDIICKHILKLDETYVWNSTIHPNPREDSLFKENAKRKGIDPMWGWSGTYVFGFESPKQLLHWFHNHDDLIRLEDAGIRVAIYECDDVIVGNSQVGFNQIWHRNNEPVEILTPCQLVDNAFNSAQAS